MRRLLGLVAAPVVLLLDQVTKLGALWALPSEGASRPLLGPLDMTLVFNRSNAFGVVPDLGPISRWGLVVFNVAVAAVLVVWSVRKRPSSVAIWAAGFLCAGALGNAVDRFRLGIVIDFLDLSRLGFHWVFNLADASVDVGIALMLIAAIRGPEVRSQAAAAGSR